MIRVLNSFGERPQDVAKYLKANHRCNSDTTQITCLNHREELGIAGAWRPFDLDYLYRNRDARLIRFYESVERRCDKFDVFLVNHENVYHPDFITKLSKKVYTVLYTGDDPESSYHCSQPYVWAFDHVFCYSVFYDAETLMVDKLKAWGAKRANWRPHGYFYYRHDENISENELFRIARDIDVLYVGGPYNKIGQLHYLRKYFGKRFHLYGHWGGVRAMLGRFRRYGWMERVKSLPPDSFVHTYQRAKIGINMHMGYGPNNLRMWELPINGVMQVTDNPVGTGTIFTIGKEVACYENGNVQEAGRLIDYYLTHERERIDMARASYQKVKSTYSFEAGFANSLRHIGDGINEKHHTPTPK